MMIRTQRQGPAGNGIAERRLAESVALAPRDRRPRAIERAPQPLTPHSAAIARSVAPQLSAGVLIIDDDEKRARMIEAALAQLRFTVRCAADGPAGLALMAEQLPDLLLVNALLPGMPGIDVCRHLRRAGLDVPIIVSSPRSDEIDVVVTMEMGADDYIAEPYGMRELVARVRAVLRRSKIQSICDPELPAFGQDVPRARQSQFPIVNAAQENLHPTGSAAPGRWASSRNTSLRHHRIRRRCRGRPGGG